MVLKQGLTPLTKHPTASSIMGHCCMMGIQCISIASEANTYALKTHKDLMKGRWVKHVLRPLTWSTFERFVPTYGELSLLN